jgi:fermentation-respiration switch protein FrsA (DUF1100 family)
VRKVKTFLLPVIVVASVYLVVCVAAFLMQRQLIYHPYRQILMTPAAIGLEYDEFVLQSPDGVEFVVWHIPSESSLVNVVYFHGNAENTSNSTGTYKLLHELGVNVYAFEYRGYANCTGTPSEDGITTDLKTFSEYLTKSLPTDAKTVALGRSLGGAVAAKFATLYPVDGIILESTFNRMADVGRKAFPYLPISFLLRERYDSEEILRSLDKPVLVIHSPDDEVIPFELGRKLFTAAIGEKSFVEIKGSHNSGLDISEETLRTAYRGFFDKFGK